MDCVPRIVQAPLEASTKGKGRRLAAGAEATSSDSVAVSTRYPLKDLSLGANGRTLKQAMPISGKIAGGFVGGGSGMSIGPIPMDPNGQNFVTVATLTLTVADPRQPTAALTLELPSWVRGEASS